VGPPLTCPPFYDRRGSTKGQLFMVIAGWSTGETTGRLGLTEKSPDPDHEDVTRRGRGSAFAPMRPVFVSIAGLQRPHRSLGRPRAAFRKVGGLSARQSQARGPIRRPAERRLDESSGPNRPTWHPSSFGGAERSHTDGPPNPVRVLRLGVGKRSAGEAGPSFRGFFFLYSYILLMSSNSSLLHTPLSSLFLPLGYSSAVPGRWKYFGRVRKIRFPLVRRMETRLLAALAPPRKRGVVPLG